MTRILLAYCHLNAQLASIIATKLGRIGIPFEHITDLPDDAPGQFATRLHQSEEPVLLLVTDNLLKSAVCMSGLLPVAQMLAGRQLLLPVVADGKNAQGEATQTHIDRMVNALQYMNHWQNAWLDLSARQQQAVNSEERAALEPALNENRTIANQVGDLIGALRDAGAVEWPSFQHNDFALFFQKFNLEEWHEQYKRLASQSPAPAPPPAAVVLAEAPVVAGGLLTLVPMETETPPLPHPVEPPPVFSEMDALLEEAENEDAASAVHAAHSSPVQEPGFEPSEQKEVSETDVAAMIHDAWFWIQQGHAERGIELFELALEQYPDHEGLRSEYQKAIQHKEASTHSHPTPASEIKQARPEEQPLINSNEAKSYDLMGDMAAEKGDYLFAKYCWDRAAELNPHFPGVFRKLGLMTYEHLRDYKETALVYLHKALEVNANDAEILLALADNAYQIGERDEAARHYTRAISLEPGRRTPSLDHSFLGESASAKQASPPSPPLPALPALPALPTTESTQPTARQHPAATPQLTVLITGATSGIGRATAELFAQHGHRLILTGRRTERLSAMNREFEEKYGVDTLMLPFDVRDQRTVQHIFEALPEPWQDIDVLLNNAGLAKGLAPIHEGDLDHWETMIDTNIKGLLYVTRAIAPGMVRRRCGHIINISSSAGKEVYANGAVYCATKFAVEALTRAIRLDLHKHNIRVSQVSPGHVEETEFAITRFDGDAERARIYDDFQPLKARDVAEAIYFIATRPPHVNIQDIWMFGSQQASATVVDRSGRK